MDMKEAQLNDGFVQIEWSEVKAAPLGRTFSTKALKEFCKAIGGGISWPSKRPGFAVVVAVNCYKRQDIHEICLLEEAESRDMWELIQKCAALQLKYEPVAWWGDPYNTTAHEFIQKMSQSTISVSESRILKMDQPYQYMLQSLQYMMKHEPKQLDLKDGRVKSYLLSVEEDAETELEFGDYPAIEALTFAVTETKDHRPGLSLKEIKALQKKYLGLD